MTLCVDDFREFVWPLLERLQEKNERIRQRFGDYAQWEWNPDEASLTLSDPGKPDLHIDVTLVGTTEGRSWEWSWANPNIDPTLKRDMEQVREFGREHGYLRLVDPFVEADQTSGLELTAVAAHILNAQGSFYFATGDGFCYLVYRKMHEPPLGQTAPAASAPASAIDPDDDGWDEKPIPLSLV
jgi:hypothetical protein